MAIKLQKTIVSVLLVSILSMSGVLILPKKTSAVLFVPTYDAATAATTGSTATGTWVDYAQVILEWVQETLVAVLKKQLIAALQNAVFAAIQGGGAPGFPIDWQDLFRGISNDVWSEFGQLPGNVLSRTPYCASFGPAIRKMFGGTGDGPSNCSLGNIIGGQLNINFEVFYKDFSKGGFLGFATAQSPENNYYVSVMRTMMEGEKLVENDVFTSWSELIAGGGFFDTKKCFQKPDGSQKCPTTTPGSVKQGATIKATIADFELVLSIDKIADVLTQAITQLVSSVLNEGITSLSGFFDQNELDQAQANLDQSEEERFEDQKNNTITGIKDAQIYKTEIKTTLEGDITQLESYLGTLRGYKTIVDNKSVTRFGVSEPASAFQTCSRTYLWGAIVANSEVNIQQLISDLDNEISSAEQTITSLKQQSQKTQDLLDTLDGEIAFVEGLQNNTTDAQRLANKRGELTGVILPTGAIKAEQIIAESAKESRKNEINENLNGEGGFKERINKFDQCSDQGFRK